MIGRSRETLIVEGLVVGRGEGGAAVIERRRIEIDTARGTIEAVGEPQGSGDLVLDDDHLVFPGFSDVHVHAREDPSGRDNYKEDFRSAGRAALRGGVTALAEMPNNPRPPIDDASYVAKRDLARQSEVDVLLYAGVGPRTRPLSFPVPYKAFLGPSIGELFFRSPDELRDALARYRGQRVSFHCESPEILERCRKERTHALRRPPEAEVEAIEQVIALCSDFGIEPNICHVSTAAGLAAIREARARGRYVTCEVTPQHLYYDQDTAAGFHRPQFLQCNPPIRTRLDRIALLEGLKNGEIDYFATDHAPHSLEENETGISGMPHLDTFGAFLFWLRDEGATWERILGAACEHPGKLLNRYLPGLRGRIEKGFVGSLSVLRQAPRTIRRTDLETKAGWSPFEGVEFSGHVSHAIVRGKVYPAAAD